MSPGLPLWAEVAVAALLILSGGFVVISAVGYLRLPHFFQRMHPPALAYTLGSWCVALAGIITFSLLDGRVALQPLLILVFLAMTVPVTTVLLARVALFRRRAAGVADTPPPLSPPRSS
jgi:multicomponent K+:H+ antiporter subunit G